MKRIKKHKKALYIFYLLLGLRDESLDNNPKMATVIKKNAVV